MAGEIGGRLTSTSEPFGGLTRQQKVSLLAERMLDDVRSRDLNQIDEQARATNGWGSPAHRRSREVRERSYEQALGDYQKLSDQELDNRLQQSER
jgi:hypothetical protein